MHLITVTFFRLHFCAVSAFLVHYAIFLQLCFGLLTSGQRFAFNGVSEDQSCPPPPTTGGHDQRQPRQYCVIGAGPAGLQLGYFFNKAARDYVIFERANISGSFFAAYPRHRKLISINKRHTGQTNSEFNMRHDWNSLLSDDQSLLFRYYSQEFFPSADSMVKYVNDFRNKLGISVQYNTDIRNIKQHREDHKSEECDQRNDAKQLFSMEDQHGNVYWCRNVIISTGLWKPNQPNFRGSDLTVGYESVSIDPKQFEGKTILILGRGNSAFETADAIYGHTNLVHMVSRSRARLSWSTHYVGDLRAINNGLLDTYQLKSLDGLLEAPVEEMIFEKRHNKIFIRLPWQLTTNVSNSSLSDSQKRVGAELDNFSLREGYDYVIRCLGFHFDDSIFDNSTKPGRGKGLKAKYPEVLPTYESPTIPNLYFAGTITHSLDFRKSAGGFIHGFRYTARVLHRLLEYKNHGTKWPGRIGPLADLLNFIVRRINEAAGLYQMFGTLADIIALQINETHRQYHVYDEFPVNQLHQFQALSGHQVDQGIIVMMMIYGPNFSGPDKDTFRPDRATGDPLEAHLSNFLHPVFYYYDRLPTKLEMQQKPPSWILPRPKRIHHVLEDFLTSWTAPLSHILPLRRFLEYCIGQDLRHFFAESCFHHALTHTRPPLTCQDHFLTTQGVSEPIVGSLIPQQVL